MKALIDGIRKVLSKAVDGRGLGLIWGLGMVLALSPAHGTELVLGHFVATNHPLHQAVFLPLADRLKSDSSGQLTLRIVPNLPNPAGQLERVRSGEFDMVFGLPGYTPDDFLRTRLVELPEIGTSAAEGTQMLETALPVVLGPDFAGVVPLALWVNEPSILVSRVRPIRRWEDLVGMKVRAGDPTTGRLLTRVGAIPVILPANQILAGLQSGELDAVVIGSSGILPFQLRKASAYCTTGLPVLVTSFYLLMNQVAWNAQSPEAQGWLRAATGPGLAATATAANEQAGEEGLASFRDSGGEVIALSPTETSRFAAQWRGVEDEVLAKLDGQGIDGQAVLDTFRPRIFLNLAGSGLEVLVRGGAGLTYQLESSSDLRAWSSIGVLVGNAEGRAAWSTADRPEPFRQLRVTLP